MENYITIDTFSGTKPVTAPTAVPIAAPSVVGDSVGRDVDPEVVAAFRSAMEKPIADNLRLGEAMRSIVSEIPSAATEQPVAIGARDTERTVVDGALATAENLVGSGRTTVVERSVTVQTASSVEQPAASAEKPVIIVSERPIVEVVERPPVELAGQTVTAVDAPVAVEKAVAEPAASAEKPVVIVSERPIVEVVERPPVELAGQTATAVDAPVAVESTVAVEEPVAVDNPVATERAPVETKSEKSAVAAVAAPVTEDDDEQVVLQSVDAAVVQAAPAAAPAPVEKTVAVDGVAPVEATAAVKTPQAVMLEAASAVADVLLVSPSLTRGTGEIVVQLKPDVLDGAVVRIEVQGRELKVVFDSPIPTTAAVIERAAPQLETMLSEKIHNFDFQVVVAQSVNAAAGVASVAQPAATVSAGGVRKVRTNERG